MNFNLLDFIILASGMLLGRLAIYLIEWLSIDEENEAELSDADMQAFKKMTFVGLAVTLALMMASAIAVLKWSEKPAADLFFSFFLLVVGGVDLKTKTIVVPSLLIGGGISAVLAFASGMGIMDIALGGAVGFGVYYAIYAVAKLWYKREAFGYGDVLFMGAIGLFLGPWMTLLAGFLTFYVALVWIVIQKTIGRILSVKSEIAFAPYMAVAAWLTALFGNQIIELYLRLFMV